MLGIMRAGGVIVPMHAQNAHDGNVRFLQAVAPCCVLYDRSLEPEAAALSHALPHILAWIDLEDLAPDPAGALSPIDPAVMHWVDAGGNATRPMYFWPTSGTTAEPKIVVNDCGSFDVAHRTMRTLLDDRRGSHVSLTVAPLSHTAGPYALTMLTLGATLVVMRTFDAKGVLAAIEEHRVT